MAPLPPAVAAVRLAVRRALSELALPAGPGELARPAGPVLVACSGGPDSLALAAACAFVAPRLGRRAGLVTVDHQLQPGSAERAAQVAGWARGVGLDPVIACRASVAGRPGGPEAAARAARYQALVEAAGAAGASAVLLGHTLDDQAETVLLALARGAGPRGLAGMPRRRVVDGVTFVRPLLEVRRADTAAACREAGHPPWQDPHNSDPAYTRSRVRAALPVLIEALGTTGVVANLARTAALVAADNEVLDGLAAKVLESAVDAPDRGLGIDALGGCPDAVRTRVLHRWARSLGVAAGSLSARHVRALDALVCRWHGQGAVALPGGVHVVRDGRRLVRSRTSALVQPDMGAG